MRTHDPIGLLKCCNVCHDEKDEAEFYWQISKKGGVRTRYRDHTCRECRDKQQRARRSCTRSSTHGRMLGLSPTAHRFLALRFGDRTTSTRGDDSHELAGT